MNRSATAERSPSCSFGEPVKSREQVWDGPDPDATDRILAAEGFGAEYNRVPAYPVFLAPLRAITGDPITGTRILQGILTGAGCLLTLLLGLRFFGARAAIAAAVFYAIDPLLALSGGGPARPNVST